MGTPLKYSEVQTTTMIDPLISSAAMMYQSPYPPMYNLPYGSYPHQMPTPIYSDPNAPYIYPVPHDIPYDFIGHNQGYFVPYCQPQMMYYNEPPSPIFCNTQNNPPIVECNNEIDISQASSKEEGSPIEKKSLNVEAKEWNGPVGKPLQ